MFFFSSRRAAPGTSYHVIFVPRCLYQVDVILEEEGLHGKVTVHDFAWYVDNKLITYNLSTEVHD